MGESHISFSSCQAQVLNPGWIWWVFVEGGTTATQSMCDTRLELNPGHTGGCKQKSTVSQRNIDYVYISHFSTFRDQLSTMEVRNVFYYVLHLFYQFFLGCDESKKTSHQDGSCCECHLWIVLDAQPVHLCVQLLHSFTELWQCHLYTFYCSCVMQFHSESFYLRFRKPEIST